MQLSEHCATALPPTDHTHISSMFANGRDDRRCWASSISARLLVTFRCGKSINTSFQRSHRARSADADYFTSTSISSARIRHVGYANACFEYLLDAGTGGSLEVPDFPADITGISAYNDDVEQ
jgi:hypothetical protein